VAAAELGFCPVPLFNALPGSTQTTAVWEDQQLPIAAVDVWSIVAALIATAPRLRGGGPRGASVLGEAPPAFLVDAARLRARGPLHAGRFDNRSAHSPADFPSGAHLRQAGLERVVVLGKGSAPELDRWGPGWDLVPTLDGWRGAGLRVDLKDLDGPPRPWPARRAVWLLRLGLWLRRLALAGDGRRGFGGWVTASGG